MFRALYHAFLSYRSLLAPILVASAVVVPCWLAFRLYRLRRSGHRWSFGREVLLLTFVLYLSALAAVTLAPSRSSRTRAEGVVEVELRPSLAALTCSSASLPRGSTARAFCVRNARGNLALFLPLGLLLPLVWRQLRFRRGMQIAIALSVGIELAQYLSRAVGSRRTVDVNDVVLNVLGACLGLGVVHLLRFLLRHRPAVQHA